MASPQPTPHGYDVLDAAESEPGAGAWGEWNPTEDSVRPIRGRHRVVKQRGGLARGSTVLGVGVIAAVGASGFAHAAEKPQPAISVPSADLEEQAQAEQAPTGGQAEQDARQAPAPVETPDPAVLAPAEAIPSVGGAGEALLNRLLQQAEYQADAENRRELAQAADAAQESAAREAREAKVAAQTEKDEADQAAKEATAKAERAAAEEVASRSGDRSGAGASEGSGGSGESAGGGSGGAGSGTSVGAWALPTSSYVITARYGTAGSMWSSGSHTGLDFAAPVGTPVKAVNGGTIVSAGWANAYGYRIVLRLTDGTEIWYCHLSSMSVTSGGVAAGETIGRVGKTGNVTGAHLHLEVRSGGQAIDPAAYLRGKGLTI
ncbi:peptidoglycan DD-metalloendopeptidase family protein [Streptomyces sp. BI20]|uniref:M23 family metallopeptidase n=1 Tax=Streptomyces sp. BI20 TaxID=3403460 RepID=UPI003C74B72F